MCGPRKHTKSLRNGADVGNCVDAAHPVTPWSLLHGSTHVHEHAPLLSSRIAHAFPGDGS